MNKVGKNENPIIIALNFNNRKEALSTIEKLLPYTKRFKIGLPLYARYGNDIIIEAIQMGAHIFLDLKLHDIPSVVASTVEIIKELNIEFLTLHASGGSAMLKEAKKAASNKIKLLGVTVLTSISEHEFSSAYGNKISEAVNSLARISYEAGLYGIVCSGLEVSSIKKSIPHIITVVPGIRLEHSATDDQARITSPCKAIKNGADFLVIGRDITHHKNPVERIKLYIERLNEC